MLTRLVLPLLAALLPHTPLQAFVPPAMVSEADLLRHIEVLASDSYEGRRPGTPGETKTLAYIVDQFGKAGLAPAGADGGWFQAVDLVKRQAGRSSASFRGTRGRAKFGSDSIVFLGREARERLADAPVWFAGHGARLPEKGIDQIADADVREAIVLILYDGPEADGFPDYRTRVKAMADAGAAAVIGIVGADMPWDAVVEGYNDGQNRLADDAVAPLQGAMTLSAAQRLFAAAGIDLPTMLDEGDATAFRASALALRGAITARTRVDRIASRNILGRIAGLDGGKENVLLLGHWDHLGICAPKEKDRICNGAVDNASGIATLIETARTLTAGPKPTRDILFLATTAEEMGLLGAEAFARAPSVPLASIVAAVNVDTAAIAPRGEPVAIIGRGTTTIDPVADLAAEELGRTIDTDLDANVMIRRQDGWTLTQRGVPTVMVGGSFSDMERLKAFLGGAYHRPSDDLAHPIELGGAAEDTDLLVALAGRLADPSQYPTPPR